MGGLNLAFGAMDLSKIVGNALRTATAATPPAAEKPRQSVSEVMRDLSVPPAIKKILVPLISQVGGTLQTGMAKDPYAPSTTRAFSIVQCGAERRFLISVPAWLLSEYDETHRNALMAVPVMFNSPALVLILSENLDVPHRILRNVIEGYWKKNGVTGIVVPWRDIEELAQDANGAETLKDILLLNAQPTARAPISWDFNDIDTIVDVLANASTFGTPTNRRNFIDISGLLKICEAVDFNGPSIHVARSVTLKLRDHGWLKDSPNVHALGALLHQLGAEEDLSLEQKQKLTEIVERYQLGKP